MGKSNWCSKPPTSFIFHVFMPPNVLQNFLRWNSPMDFSCDLAVQLRVLRLQQQGSPAWWNRGCGFNKHVETSSKKSLVSGGKTPLKNDGVRQLGWSSTPNISGKIKLMFQARPPTKSAFLQAHTWRRTTHLDRFCGLVHPGSRWDKWGQCPLITRVITHLLSGMNHQV